MQDITVLIPTSPIPDHPSTAIIDETIKSVRYHLPEAKILIMVDGIRRELKHREKDYNDYKIALYKYTLDNSNTDIVTFDDHLHQAGITKNVINSIVSTQFVLFVEHDTPLVTDYDIDFTLLQLVIENNGVDVIRLNHEACVLPEHEEYLVNDSPLMVNDYKFVKTLQWSQRPHLARTKFYQEMLNNLITPKSNTMIEDAFHAKIAKDRYLLGSHRCWDKYKILMYAPDGNMKRSYHLDGRKNDPKFDMVFERQMI